MIRFVDEKLRPALEELTLRRDVCACRINCLLQSYGTGYDFVRFWLQLPPSGTPAAAVVKYDSAVTVFLTDRSDLGELREFVRMLGWGSLSANAPLLPGQEAVGVVMELSERISPPALPEGLVLNESPRLLDVYALLESCRDELQVPAYESFLLDLSHKLRHGTALCCTLERGGRTVACAMTVSRSSVCAVIGAVAVGKEYRRRGYGSLCVRALCSRLSDSTVLLQREPRKNREFYEALGFRGV